MADRQDLGATLYRLAQEVIRREEPLLAAHGLGMWDYAVLAQLAAGPTPTQGQLAERTGRDATRLIPILDRLQAGGLVERVPDPRDRRNRVVSLTDAGQQLLGQCKAAIRAMEDDALAGLTAAAREAFLDTLDQLARDWGVLGPPA